MAAELFAVAPTGSILSVARGWQWNYDRQNNKVSSVAESRNAQISYDPLGAAYRGKFPLLGEGLIFQTSAASNFGLLQIDYRAALAANAASATSGSGLHVLRTKPEYQHVAVVEWYGAETPASGPEAYGYGVVGLFQPTPTSSIPLAGSRSYWGGAVAYLSGNFADAVAGTADVQIDLSAATFSMNLDLRLVCFMGCLYPTVPYSAVATSVVRGATSFSGELQTNNSGNRGSFVGHFAGPGAREILIEFRAPFYNPDWQVWTELSGIAIARMP